MARLIERFESQPGEWAWRVTSHKDVKALLADERLYGPHVMRVHTAWRKTMNKVFSSTIFDGLVPFIRDVSAALLDEMISAGPPADVHEIYSTSLTAQVMCELLSVPPGDISLFREWAQEGDDNTPMPDGMGKLMSYAEQLMAERGDEPAEDAVSALLMARAGSEKAHALRSAKLLAGMLAFGWQTPAAMIDSGVELLLANPAQRQLLDEQPALISRAVEEVLRLTRAPLAVEGGVHRRAYTDVEVGDVTVRAGDKVLLDIVAATRTHEELDLGVSTRGAVVLFRAVQCLAFLETRNFVIPDDVKRLAVPVLAHRIVCRGLVREGQRDRSRTVIRQILQKTRVPA